MSARAPVSAASVARLRAYAGRRLTPDEVQAWLSVPISEEERAHALSLIRWFRRRYPEPADRLAYVRRAYARWLRRRPGEAGSDARLDDPPRC
jgi:hypothetical protein